MDAVSPARQAERRLLLEDICSDLIRSVEAAGRADSLGDVIIDREWSLGQPGMFADLRVQPPGERPYFVEIKTGYTSDEVVQHVARKYCKATPRVAEAEKLVLVVETRAHSDWSAVLAAIRQAVPQHLAIEVWDEAYLDEFMGRAFGVDIERPSDEAELIRLRGRIDAAKRVIAFGDEPSNTQELVFRDAMVWHFGVWRVRELRRMVALEERSFFEASWYRHIVVLMCDLSSFSSYMRDTRDEAIVRSNLTAFYAKARYQIVNAGGMFYQFAGDEVSAFFGVPDHRPDYVDASIRTARALLQISRSVSHEWQRQIDRRQDHGGAHIGMAMGDVGLVGQRPFDPARVGAFGDVLNLAGRLLKAAGPDEIVMSNGLRRALPPRYEPEPIAPVEARNVGLVDAWKLTFADLAPTSSSGGS